MTVRSLTRRRQQAHQLTPSGNTSTLVLDPNTPTVISRLLGRPQHAPTEGGSSMRRLLHRAHDAWENGSLWIAFVIGVICGGAQPDEILTVLAVIMTAGPDMGTQIIAAIAFVVGTQAVVEIALAAYMVTPTKTQAVLRRVHDWASAHRRKILIAILLVSGVALVLHGMGSA
jgi:hypothetical protein